MKKRGFIYELSRNRTMHLMVLPVIVFFVLFSYLPIVGIYYAFTRFDYGGGLFGSPFVGLRNFRFLFLGGQDAIIWRITKNTVLYNLAFIITGNVFQIATAVILSELPGKLFRRTTQSIMFFPYFISYVLVGLFVYNIFSYSYGLVNSVLRTLGRTPVNFYGMPSIWKYILVAVHLWKGLGYGTVIYLAAIMGIDRSFYEAADVDGANIFQKIRCITLPLLKPTFILLILFSLGGILRGQFDLFFQIVGNNGALFRATDIIDTYVYRLLVVSFDMGLGTAAGLYQSVFGLLVVLLVNGIIRKVNPDYALF